MRAAYAPRPSGLPIGVQGGNVGEQHEAIRLKPAREHGRPQVIVQRTLEVLERASLSAAHGCVAARTDDEKVVVRKEAYGW